MNESDIANIDDIVTFGNPPWSDPLTGEPLKYRCTQSGDGTLEFTITDESRDGLNRMAAELRRKMDAEPEA